ncbi:MAG TPA: hemerythrin domain-containing protein [Alphaproteobacteria bacterium]|jgi:hemerythrin-like domain-containing protein|nr:hemerythrin domain-containing protein [Alphaproteobacteria bacterium]MDP7163907.1 hemerythrin domain-containing protein [Alphaproteobacteria bacterium]MDP7427621.1 hemerythrin domain-containing protein [Alphaproteobacteria bacterium]HJM50895.1 hemerythrin domain-containing protein [Alphaproteobacteria bacterium]|tara:strand:- start:349 stop:891 length:543 start_codon:yes stop_codon:yes gene_type:complete
MANAFADLSREHLAIASLTDVLERHFGSGARGYHELPSVGRLMACLFHCPSKGHELREQALGNALAEASAAARPLLEVVAREHAAVAGSAAELNALVAAAARGDAVACIALPGMVLAHIGLLRRHIEREEGELFPLALEVLGEAAIAELLAALEESAAAADGALPCCLNPELPDVMVAAA